MYDLPSAVYGVSFVDVTPTNVIRGEGLKRNQQRNWETVLQTFGLLTQPIILELPEKLDVTDKDNFVGSEVFRHMGTKHQFVVEMMRPDTTFWTFAIGSENEDVLQLSRLNELFDMIPVIDGLNETIKLDPSMFRTLDKEYNNIAFFNANKTNK